MLNTSQPSPFMKRFTLQEALWLGFCATFIVISRAGFRLHLHLPGHVMFFTMLFLLLGRGCVPKNGAATMVGLIAGALCLLMGLGKSGPLLLLKYVLPGLIVDLGGLIYTNLPASYIGCAAVGLLASATRAFAVAVVDAAVGMETSLIIEHALITTLSGSFFAVLGSLLVPPIIRRLKANRLI